MYDYLSGLRRLYDYHIRARKQNQVPWRRNFFTTGGTFASRQGLLPISQNTSRLLYRLSRLNDTVKFGTRRGAEVNGLYGLRPQGMLPTTAGDRQGHIQS